MINQSTVETLRQMRMGAMAQSLEEQLLDHETYVKLSFEERLAILVDAEWSKRQANRLNRYIRSAQFSNPEACIEGIEYHPDRKLDKVQMLRLSTCSYIDQGHHLILEGASGNGKTWIACALGIAACRKFKSMWHGDALFATLCGTGTLCLPPLIDLFCGTGTLCLPPLIDLF